MLRIDYIIDEMLIKIDWSLLLEGLSTIDKKG